MDKTFELMLNVFLLTSTHTTFASISALTFFNLIDLSTVGCMFSKVHTIDISKKGNKENEFQTCKCQVHFKSQSICHPNGESTMLTTMSVVTF